MRKPKAIAMDWITARPLGDAPDAAGRWLWQARYRAGARRVSRGIGRCTRDEAVAAVKALHDAGQDVSEAAVVTEIVTVTDLVECWLGEWVAKRVKAGRLSPESRTRYRYSAKRIKETIGTTRAAALSSDALDRWETDRAGLVSQATAAVDAIVLAMAQRWAVRAGHLSTAPVSRRRAAPRRAREVAVPSVAEAAKVLDAIGGWPAVGLWLAMETGARIGEVARMLRRDVSAGWWSVRGKGHRTRSVELGPDLLAALAPYLVGDPDGHPWPASWQSSRQRMERALRAGCEAAEVRPFTPHGLRHLAVDRLARAGIDAGAAARQTGHSPEVMLRIYRQVSTDDLHRTGAVLRLKRGKVLGLRAGATRRGNTDSDGGSA